MTLAAAPLDKRDQYIPARKRELFAALLADLVLDADADAPAARVYELMVALIHHEFLRELELLHDAYILLDPDEPRGGDAAAGEAAYAALSTSLEHVLKSANFIEIDPALVQQARTEVGRVRASLRHNAVDFRNLRLFRRGQHGETIVRRSWLGLRKRIERLEVFDEVVLVAAVRPSHNIAPEPPGRRRRKRKLAGPHGSVLIKYFHDIAIADLDAIYPGSEVVLSTGDKLSLALPALIAGIPLVLKLIPAALVLYGVMRLYMGGRPPGAASLTEALIVAGGLIALGGFLGNQWTSFQRRALLHQRDVNEMIYFHNITNNVGIFDHIIRNAEEQDCKEAVLAYFTLAGAKQPLTQAELDSRIEAWLKTRLGLDVDFEVDDALRKLDAYGLLLREGDRLTVPNLYKAVAVLDRHWDNLFGPMPGRHR